MPDEVVESIPDDLPSQQGGNGNRNFRPTPGFKTSETSHPNQEIPLVMNLSFNRPTRGRLLRAASLLFFLASGLVDAQAAERANIIFMLSDDQAWNGLSVAMHPEIAGSQSKIYQTPAIERLAVQGMRFSNAYSPSSVCAATRCSLQTGLSAAANRWTKAGPSIRATAGHPWIPPQSIRNLPASRVTIGEQLQAAGYATAHYGKWHLRGGGPGEHGYDDHDGDTGNERAEQFADPNPVDIFGMAERAERFMQQQVAADKPFFIQMSWLALHSPWNALKATQAKYQNMAVRGRAGRLAAITEDLDTGVGRVLAAVERLNIAENTYVIYMSDNGAGGASGNGPLNGGKGSVWEGGIRVPLIIRGPGIAANSWCHTPVVGYDFYPTFCEWAQIPSSSLPPEIEGGSLVKLLQNEGQGRVARSRKELVFHFPHYQSSDGPHSAIRVDDLKLIRFDETGKRSLFDLAKDPGERQDLAAAEPRQVQRLEKQLNEYLQTVKADLATRNPNYDPNVQRTDKRRNRGGRKRARPDQ